MSIIRKLHDKWTLYCSISKHIKKSRIQNGLEKRADELGISVIELVCKYVELGRTIEEYYDNNDSQLVIYDPKNWEQTEMGVPYGSIMGVMED